MNTFDPNITRQERTGWRDEKISLRHRFWGYNCPAVDLDFLVVEYNLGKPVALIEYKHEGARMPDFNHATYRAIRELANMSNLPFMVVFYNNESWWFRVYPQNDNARKIYREATLLAEKRYVESLYYMRGLVIEKEVLSKLSDKLPPMLMAGSKAA